MDYCFDTSALNRLHDDPDCESIIRGILAANRVLITALNIREAVATESAERRVSLLKLQRRLTGKFRPIRPPIELLKQLTLARIDGRESVTLTIEENARGLWSALQEPEGISIELQEESYQWKKDLENQFDDAHRRSRPEMARAFTGPDRPRSFAKLVRFFFDNPRLALPTVSAVHHRMTGKSLDLPAMIQLFSEAPEWPLYMAGWAQGLYVRALQTHGYSPRRNAGTVDLWFAVYLAHCDCLVTDDRAQYKALRVINRIGPRRGRRAVVMLYDHLLRRVVLKRNYLIP